MEIRVLPSKLKGKIAAVSSKSDAHRLLIAAALSREPTVIRLNTLSKDIEATAGCLEALGCRIERGSDTLTVSPVWQNLSDSPVLHCGGKAARRCAFCCPSPRRFARNSR